MITELKVEVVKRLFEVVLELVANRAQLQAAQARFIRPTATSERGWASIISSRYVEVLEVGV